MSGSEEAEHIHTVSDSFMTAFGFRQGYAFAAEKKIARGGSAKGFTTITKALMNGDDFGADEYGSEDPVLVEARKL
jgi:hypothetical protein